MGTEALIFLAMVAIFAALAMGFKLPIGVSLALSALAGALLGGEGFALRHLVEGSFGYFDTILIIVCAMIYMQVLKAAGILDTVTSKLLKTFYSRKTALLFSMMFIVMFPGMITGSSTAAVLSTGALIAPVMIKMGLSPIKTAAFIAMGGILGMLAPPVNILVMIMGAGVDMPYMGITIPLLIIVIPLAVIFSLYMGREIKVIDYAQMRKILPDTEEKKAGIRLYLPLIILIFLLTAQSVSIPYLSDLGIPAAFLLSSIIGLFCGRSLNFLKITQDALKEAMPILGILIGVGMFIQVMTLTGGRGWTVVSFLSLPPALLYLGIGVSMPLFGAVSAYGSASILGVPFILALINRNAMLTSAALSAIAGLGDLMPPTALAGIFAAQVVGEKNYFKVLKYCLIPAAMELIMGIGILLLAPLLDKII